LSVHASPNQAVITNSIVQMELGPISIAVGNRLISVQALVIIAHVKVR
jgi:hypothetical protein